MKEKKAFTLTELMVTIVIIGILAGLAIPMFPRAIEATKAKAAVAALQQIRTGERIYRVEEGDYWRTESDVINDNEAINNMLRLDLDRRAERSWDYSLTATSGNPDTFTATAERISGIYNGDTITIDETGQLGGTWPANLLPGQ